MNRQDLEYFSSIISWNQERIKNNKVIKVNRLIDAIAERARDKIGGMTKQGAKEILKGV